MTRGQVLSGPSANELAMQREMATLSKQAANMARVAVGREGIRPLLL
jgi:hypothetical protein